MSVEIRSDRNRHTGGHYSIVKTDNGMYYYVDTSNTWDYGWETMAFPCDEAGNVLSWGGVAVDRYKNVMEALEGHAQMVERLEEYLLEYGGEETDDEDSEDTDDLGEDPE